MKCTFTLSYDGFDEDYCFQMPPTINAASMWTLLKKKFRSLSREIKSKNNNNGSNQYDVKLQAHFGDVHLGPFITQTNTTIDADAWCEDLWKEVERRLAEETATNNSIQHLEHLDVPLTPPPNAQLEPKSSLKTQSSAPPIPSLRDPVT